MEDSCGSPMFRRGMTGYNIYNIIYIPVSFRLTFGNVFGKMTLSTKFVGWEAPETDGTEINFM
jgi:hypothetical protein